MVTLTESLFEAPAAHEVTRTIPRTGGTVRPLVILRHFGFDQSALIRNPARGVDHGASIDALARRIVRSQRSDRPISAVFLEGHTDMRGAAGYNVDLGLRRAKTVESALRQAIQRESARLGAPGVASRVRITVTSAGETRPLVPNATDAGRSVNRRVEVRIEHTGVRPRPHPRRTPEPACSAPTQTKPHTELEWERQGFDSERAATAVKARLCLFQNAVHSSHRNLFECGAGRQGRKIAAIASPDAANCPTLVAGTAFDTGADIIQAIAAAQQCVGKPVDLVHIFSHSGHDGVFGRTNGQGLYPNPVSATARASGARSVTDIPAARLANGVIFVLHGCNTAAGDSNVARDLYDHLARTLDNPKVFGHFNSGCASRDNSWREYSSRSPDGAQRLRTLAPLYTDLGCCGP